MTKRERAQVVELLRCAADESPGVASIGGGINGIVRASMGLGLDGWMTYAAGQAYNATVSGQALTYEDHRARLLEAARRVEDGEWPC